MWKLVLALALSSAGLLDAAAIGVGGIPGLAIPGYLPGDVVRAVKPIGDGNANDIYGSAPLRLPVLTSEEIVIYPHHLGFEYGQDPEHRIYEVQNAKELQAQHSKHSNKKHKQAHHHHNEGDHHPHHPHHHLSIEENPEKSPNSVVGRFPNQPSQQALRPRPAPLVRQPQIHPHFGG